MNAVLALQANFLRRMGKLESAIELYANLFYEQNQPDSVQIEIGLDLAGCLFERKESAQANKALDELEAILEYYRDNDSFIADFARLWKYRAFDIRESGDVKGAVECVRKSLIYWNKIPSALNVQKQMKDFIDLGSHSYDAGQIMAIKIEFLDEWPEFFLRCLD
jgi:tetratricopeptide (TPR) repeat protein